MIDLAAEEILSLANAARALPPLRGAKPVAVSTLIRWVTSGVKGPDGRRVHLEAVRLGGRWVTSREALHRFTRALTPGQADALEARTPAGRRRAATRADRELDRLGV